MKILSHIPLWVFILFFVLVVLGFSQNRDRYIPLWRASILPVAMLIYSLYGVISSFGVTTTTLGLWAVGIVVALIANIFLKYPRDAIFLPREKLYFIKGSLIPLLLIMLIFWTKFIIGFAKANKWEMLNSIDFIGCVSFCLGIFSGIFIAGGLRLFGAIKHKSDIS